MRRRKKSCCSSSATGTASSLHTSRLTAFESWPEFLELDWRPFRSASDRRGGNDRQRESRLSLQRSHFPSSFAFNDEFYQPKDHSREKIDVLLRLDLSNVPPNPGLHLNGDYPLAWAKTYGKGRVFFSSFGHASSIWDIRDVQQMYFEAIRWALGMTDADPKPHPMRGAVTTR